MDTRRILAELRAERNRIDQAIAAIEAINTNTAGRGRGRQSTATGTRKPRRHHRLSAAGRKRLSDMMKQRWAERRKKSRAA